MFENGSYLRRRKRFKLITKSHEEKKTIKKSLLHSPNKSQQIKTSFFIDNLLGNDTNASYTTSSSESNSTLQHLLYSTEFDLVKKLTCFSDIHGQQQQVYW
jgi:hypothetical protein